MPDAPVLCVVALHLSRGLSVVRPLWNGLHARRHLQAGPERRVDPCLVIERLVPRREILEHVRQVHVGALGEVPGLAQVRVSEGLEVRDLRRAEALTLCGREAEEQLGSVRDQVRSGHPCRHCHLLRKALPAFESSSCEPPPDTRHAEQAQLLDQGLSRRRDVGEAVAPEEDGEVVSLEHRPGRVAREANRVLQRQHLTSPGRGRADVDREVPIRGRGDVPLEIRQPPGDGETEPCRGRRIFLLEAGEGALERGACVEEVATRRLDREPRRHHLVVQRRHEHLDLVVHHHAHAVEEMLLREACARRRPRGARRKPVDELVDPRRRETAGGRSAEKLTPGEAHDPAGATRTRPRINRSRFASTS